MEIALDMLDIAIRNNEIIKSNLHSNLFLNMQIVGAKAKHLKMFNLFCILLFKNTLINIQYLTFWQIKEKEQKLVDSKSG
jgi:hypothetical protein